MKTNKQDKIKVNKSGFKRSKFNWSHDVNTTFSWGEIQPTQCKLIVPNSKTTMSIQSLVRLAPMVAPTFGRVRYKTFSQFVPIAEIFPNFDALMSQEPVTTAGGTKVPSQVPTVYLSQLSSYILHGARATIYFAMDTTDGRTAAQNAAAGYYVTSYRPDPYGNLDAANVLKGYLTELVNSGYFVNNNDPYASLTSGLPSVGRRVMFDMSKVTNNGTSFLSNSVVPLALTDTVQLFPVQRGYTPSSHTKPKIPSYMREVTMDGADYVIEGNHFKSDNTAIHYAIAFELSDAGKRLRKVLQGCGYQIDFGSSEMVSVLPLVAQYKAYFDVFGLQLYQGWETTFCSKFIKYVENDFILNPNILFDGTALSDTNANAFKYFILSELMNEWYTESADWIGSHLDRLAVTPDAKTDEFISVGSSGDLQFGANVNDAALSRPDGTISSQVASNTVNLSSVPSQTHSYITQIKHGQVDTIVLQRMYRWCNRNSILGRAIEKVLRAQNLGKYCDECKSNFIGTTDVLVTISDVVSQAATEQASLGEYGGRGLQYDSSKTFVYENDSFGYWITLSTIVPESGYTQGLDPTLLVDSKFKFYHPDFDAIGMEMTSKSALAAASYINGLAPYHGDDGFGFTPMYSKFKVCYNLVNGDFNRHSKRSVYLPYTLDKQINVNDFDVDWSAYDQSATPDPLAGVVIQRSGRSSNLPVAGNVWRTPTKYSWLGNFDRIFLNVGERESESVGAYPDNWFVGFDDFNDDNFLAHNIYDLICYAPMKPIEDSYGLEDDTDDCNHAGAEFVNKA